MQQAAAQDRIADLKDENMYVFLVAACTLQADHVQAPPNAGQRHEAGAVRHQSCEHGEASHNVAV